MSSLEPLHKNGDLWNYRRVALGCSGLKLFMRVLASRLGSFAEDRVLMEVQGRFRSQELFDQWLVLTSVCVVRKRVKKTSYRYGH